MKRSRETIYDLGKTCHEKCIWFNCNFQSFASNQIIIDIDFYAEIKCVQMGWEAKRQVAEAWGDACWATQQDLAGSAVCHRTQRRGQIFPKA